MQHYRSRGRQGAGRRAGVTGAQDTGVPPPLLAANPKSRKSHPGALGQLRDDKSEASAPPPPTNGHRHSLSARRSPERRRGRRTSPRLQGTAPPGRDHPRAARGNRYRQGRGGGEGGGRAAWPGRTGGEGEGEVPYPRVSAQQQLRVAELHAALFGGVLQHHLQADRLAERERLLRRQRLLPAALARRWRR